jgi:hypothetical protein
LLRTNQQTLANSGIAGVVPASRLRDLLYEPYLCKKRKEEEMSRKRNAVKPNAPIEDSAENQKRKNRDIPIPPVSRKKFFDDLTKATRKLK